MKTGIYFYCIAAALSFLFADTKTFTLTDGTVITGTVLSETDSSLVINSQFGVITIDKSQLVKKKFSITLSSGEKLIGTKISEGEHILILNTQMGSITIQKKDIARITEIGKETVISSAGGTAYRRPYSLMDFLISGGASMKDTDFSLGEEQLIDLFFDPTGYTLPRSTLYLSGLSFGFGVTDKFQITTKWGGFFWGDMNLRPKIKIFESGNWEKQHAFSVGAHYHSRWNPNKYEWKSGITTIKQFTGSFGEYGSDNCPSGIYCWQQTAPAKDDTMHWGGFYKIGSKGYETPAYDYPSNYNAESTEVFYDYQPSESYDYSSNDNFLQMIEIFGAYTYSTARAGLRGRISHTLGGHVQKIIDNDENALYRAYYGLDVDINPKLKMIGEVFYDPYFLEYWQSNEYHSEKLSATAIEKPADVNPLHFDFGFMYALNETFRFGLHFQKPFIGFYWKF